MELLKIFLAISLCVTVHANVLRSGDPVADLEEYILQKIPEINTRYKLHYHITPPVGWMNDPNGFIFFKGQYHVFFQYYPYDSQWGPMHWGHVWSSDLAHWEYLPTALIPENEMCFSGSAVDMDGTLALMYTGRVNGEGDSFNETQYLAFSDDGIKFEKYAGNPVLLSPNSSPDFRDPKAWRHGDYWYVVIGSTTDDNLGQVLLFRSADMFEWSFLSVIAYSTSEKEMGYMWECPDFFELNGKHVLLMSPQGLEPNGDRYKNQYQTGYILGSFDFETFEFKEEVSFQEIDFGHDFYASQTTEVDGKRILVAWFNMWETDFPEALDGWAGALTIFREINLVGDRITMNPVETMVNLRSDVVIDGTFAQNETISLLEKTGEIIVNDLDLNTDIELHFTGSNGGGEISLKWDTETGKVVLDRAGDVRQTEWELIGSKSWRIFLDASSIEVFCGEGEVVFSSRVYPNDDWRITNVGPQTLNIVAYKLNKSI